MQIVIYGLGILGAIGLTLVGILFSSNKTACIWISFATIVVWALAFCLYWQDSIFKSRQIREKQIELVEPTFSEDIEKIMFSFGSGMGFGYSRAALEEKPVEPVNFGGFKPVRLYIEGKKLYADVKIYGGSGLPPIEIKRNKVLGKPPDWDMNSNKNAMEIVNEKHIPIYQFIYKTPAHIVMNGIFPFPGGLILANKQGAIVWPKLPTTFSMKRIFKYPSWKYPGQYEESRGED